MQITLHNKTYSFEQLPTLINDRKSKSMPDWESALINFLDNWLDNTNNIIAQTSGSTGIPKQITLSKKSMKESAQRTNRYFNMCAGDKALMCLSANYIAGKMMIVRAIVSNLHLTVIEPTSKPLVDEKFKFAAMVPLQIETLLETENGKSFLNRIFSLIIGGSAISKQLEDKLQDISARCFLTYGMTETVSHVALRALNGPDKSNIYEALEGISFSQDERGCLVISAPHLQQTPFITNDIVSLKSAHAFEWIGRFDNVINSGGVKIFPEQVEKKIAHLISYRFFISSIPDKKFGEKVVLVIEKEKFYDSERSELINKIVQCVDKYELPKQIINIATFDETTSGKIKRTISGYEHH